MRTAKIERRHMNRIGFLLITIILMQFAVTIGATVIFAASLGKTAFYGFAPMELLKAYTAMGAVAASNGFYLPVILLITSAAEILAAWLFSGKVGVINSKEVFVKPKNWAADTALFGVVAFGASMIVSLFVNLIRLILMGVKVSLSTPNFALPKNNLAATVIMIFVMVVLAPLAEEYMCRGVILNVFKRFGSVFAVVGSALIWSLLHGNIVQGLPVFMMGILYGILALKTESIWPTFILHSLNNLVAAGNAVFITVLPKYMIIIISGMEYMIIFLAIALFSVFYKRFRFNTAHGSSYGFKTLFTSISIIISIAACLGLTVLSFRPM